MRYIFYAGALGFSLLVGLIGIWQWWELKNQPEALPINHQLGGDFVLPSTRNQPLDTKDLRGKVVLINFGFTSCPDVCPMVLAKLKQVLAELGTEAGATQVVFISFDPERDNLTHLKAYVEHFDPRIIGATGSLTDVAVVARQYGVVYLKQASGSAAGDGFTHSDYIYLADQQGRIRKLYDTKAEPSQIVADVRGLLKESK